MTITVENLYKKYNEKIAINGLSFEVRPGEAFGLLGGNGAGKTTTIRSILGLIDFDGGQIKYKDKEIGKMKPTIGYLPEERGLYPKEKVSTQLIYLAQLEGMKKKEAQKALEYWLSKLGILEYKESRVEELSKGNQQKVQIASTLLHNPDLVILDEPFSGLDPVNSDLLSSIVKELIAMKKMVIFCSHQMNHVEKFCENICILKNGQTLVSGRIKDLKHGFKESKVFIQTESRLDQLLSNHPFITKIDKVYNGWELVTLPKQAPQLVVKELILQEIVVKGFRIMEPSLHEIFVNVVGGEKQ
ncbi:ABC transporter ATP-binding protein [Neobacillus sp. LXY-4]|uniref:ABC transporter ATP-binding protein n=1 Tax=Neobacillus sp. LXY-4 TaxID=3379826 RepID=UPI003EE1DD55